MCTDRHREEEAEASFWEGAKNTNRRYTHAVSDDADDVDETYGSELRDEYSNTGAEALIASQGVQRSNMQAASSTSNRGGKQQGKGHSGSSSNTNNSVVQSLSNSNSSSSSSSSQTEARAKAVATIHRVHTAITVHAVMHMQHKRMPLTTQTTTPHQSNNNSRNSSSSDRRMSKHAE